MQGLLARLKAVRDQPAEPDVPLSEDVNGINTWIKDGFRHGIYSHSPSDHLINRTEVNSEDNKSVQNGYDGYNAEESESEREILRTPDDGAVIDIVMETNKLTRRTRGSSSNPRHSLKKTKSRGSRVSLNSVALSEETLNLDSDDDAFVSSSPTEKYNPAQAWAAFENCVKNIDNSNPEYFVKKPKPNFVSSSTFQQVMADMYGNTEYGNAKGYTLLKQKLNNMARSTMLASRMMQAAVNKGQEEREMEETNAADDMDAAPDVAAETQAEPESVTKVFAKRGWKILKREVNETVMEQKTQSTKLNWTMLQHTLKQMSNTEKTRQDLYERYGILPTTLPDGTVVCENRMLSDRARAQLYGRNKDGAEYKRPSSYQPPSLHLRSRSQASNYHNKFRDGAKSGKLSGSNRGRIRPITAKQ